jgi:hypothetical protein
MSNMVKVAARLALNDVGECMVSAIEAVDKGDLDRALDKIDETTALLIRAVEALEMLRVQAEQPS